MNLTLHLVRKDLLRLRWWLLCWVGVLLLPVVIGASFLRQTPFLSSGWSLPTTLAGVMGLEAIAGYLLVILLLQEDAVIGTQQFWLTRPISRQRLLLAKTLGGFVVLGLLPIAVSLPWWLWNGFGAVQIAVAALELILLGTLVAIPAALIGTLTETLSRAVLWTMVLVAFLVTSPVFFQGVGHVIPNSQLGGAVHGIAAMGAAVASAMVFVTLRVFLTRRRSWTLLGAVALLPVLVFILALGLVRFLPGIDPRERNTARTTGITVKFERAWADPFNAQTQSRRERRQLVTTVFSMQGLPPTLAVNALGSRQTFRGQGWTRQDLGFPRWHGSDWRAETLAKIGLREPAEDPETELWRTEDRRRRNAPPPTLNLAKQHDVGFYSLIPPSLVARMQAEPPGFQSQVWLRLSRPEVIYELGLKPGLRVIRQGRGARIEGIVPTNAQPPETPARVAFVESSPAPLWAEFQAARQSSVWFGRHQPDFTFIAINRARGEFVDVGGRQSEKPRTLLVNGVRITWHLALLDSGTVRRDGRWVQRTGWMEGASLALLRFHDEATIKREVTVERLAVENVRARPPGGQ